MRDLSSFNIINNAYPLRFTPIIKERIWGGQKLNSLLGKDLLGIEEAGESWEISTIEGDVSVISNGALQGISLDEALLQYGEEILGGDILTEFGRNFPLLIKFLDSKADLSIQVHPDDTTALDRHQCLGKTEMWYIIDAENDSNLICGFNKDVTPNEYIERVDNGTLPDVLDKLIVSNGDNFFIPAGRIHALGAGIVLAEVQQTSDITYRIFDYNRLDKSGNPRELHTEWALDSIDFKVDKSLNNQNHKLTDSSSNIATCKHFTTNILDIKSTLGFDNTKRNNFTVLICVEGYGTINYRNKEEDLKIGETLLIPSCLKQFSLSPRNGNFKVLEVYI